MPSETPSPSSTYIWSSDFSLSAALSGTAVGLPVTTGYATAPDSETSSDLSLTGLLVRDNTYGNASFRVTLGSYPVWCNANGLITQSPDNNDFLNKSLWLVKATLVPTTSAMQTRAGGTSATVSSVTPRDTFALQALNAILANVPDTDKLNDATILSLCRSAYRWANAMMLVAAENRDPDATESSPSSQNVDVTNGTNTEKLLKSIASSIDGLKNQTATNTNTLANATIKIDNPDNDELDVSGAGASVNRADLNDTGATLTDIIVFNSAVGNAPLRTSKTNLINAIIAALNADQKTALYDAMKTVLEQHFDLLGAAADALTAAKAYTDNAIANL